MRSASAAGQSVIDKRCEIQCQVHYVFRVDTEPEPVFLTPRVYFCFTC